MSTPTYELTLLRGVSLEVFTYAQRPAEGKTVQLGYPTALKLDVRQIPITTALYTVGFGYPPATRFRPLILNKDYILYNLAFFYPSNGKIPGSPIPRHGQLLPRPL